MDDLAILNMFMCFMCVWRVIDAFLCHLPPFLLLFSFELESASSPPSLVLVGACFSLGVGSQS
jgi:hypothetical protein